MSYWTMLMVTGGMTLLGVLFAVLIFWLDKETLEELNAPEEQRRWTSLV